MAATRAKNLFLGVVFVGLLLILAAAYSFAAAPASGDTDAEEIPTPAATEKAEAPAAESADLVSEQCEDNGCTCDGVPLCSPPGRFWFRGDWMMWWTSGENLPPLVTNSTNASLPLGQAGAIGQPGTTIVYGDSTVYDDARAGVRITFGGWLDCCHRWGLEADWLTLGGKSINFSQTSNGSPIVSRPFFDVGTNAENSQPVAYPSIVTGTVSVEGNDYFESVGMTLRYNLCCNSCGECCQDTCDAGCDACCNPCCLNYCRTDLLIGYRHYLLGDNLAIHEDLAFLGSTNQITDSFMARNEFNGTEIGLDTELRRGRWSLEFLAKMAMGNNHETVTINGTTTFNNGQTTITYPVGIYAVDPNSGVHNRDQFVVIPQFGVETGYQLTCRARVFVGYNLIYWAPVMRAGEQIDRNIDTRNSAPPQADALPFPQFLARQTNFWAQGLNVGAEIRF